MSCIVYQTNKKTGVTYAYSSESYWDKDKKQPRSRRKYIGRVDPETGKIVTKADKASAKKETDSTTEIKNLQKQIKEQESQMESLQEELTSLRRRYKKATELLHRVHQLSDMTGLEG